MQRLFAIEDLFEIKERGVVVYGKVDDPDKKRYWIGDPVEIRRQGAVVVRTVIAGVAVMLGNSDFADLLLRDIEKVTIQSGDEVWLYVEGSE